MKVNELVFENHKSEKSTIPGFRVYMGMLPGNSENIIGIDPGINLGMTLIQGDMVSIFYGKLKHDKKVGWSGIAAYDFIWKMVEWRNFSRAIIEGAAYNKFHGQVVLEEVRFGLFLSCHHALFDTEIVPPATIRKVAFGKGAQQAGDIFPWMNHNGADSLGMALYGLEKYG